MDRPGTIRTHAFEQIERDVRLVGEANAVAQVVLDGGGILGAYASCAEQGE
jgi:hypothetical protein